MVSQHLCLENFCRPSMILALCIEWGKVHARATRWSKEVELLQEEMRCTKQFFEWKAQWWEQHREPPSDIPLNSLTRQGISAYADRQATVQCRLSDHFSMLWHQVGYMLPEGSDGESEGLMELLNTKAKPASSLYGGYHSSDEWVDETEDNLDNEDEIDE